MKLFLSFTFVTLMSRSSFATGGEAVRGFSVDGNKVIFTVYSGGCTAKSDFKVNVTTDDEMTVVKRIELLRMKQDFCEGNLFSLDVTYTFEELGLKGGSVFQILNPSAYFLVPDDN